MITQKWDMYVCVCIYNTILIKIFDSIKLFIS